MTGLAGHPVQPLTRLQSAAFETPAVLKKTATAGRQLAALKGLAASMPNQAILINTLGPQEAKDSSAIENIVTTHDELFRSATYPDMFASAAAKCGGSCLSRSMRNRAIVAVVVRLRLQRSR